MALREMRIRDLVEGLYDGPHATPPPADSGPVFLSIHNITDDGHLVLDEVRHIDESNYADWTKRVVPRPGDIVFTYEATLNRYAIIPDGFRGCLGRRLALLRVNEAQANIRYLHFAFFSAAWRATVRANTLIGATVDRIPLSKFLDFPIRVHTLREQDRIAEVLSAYDDLIANNTRRIAILEEMARSLYRGWIGNVQFPGHETARFAQTPVGRIPRDWTLRPLSDRLVVHRGKSYKGTEVADAGGVPFVNLKCFVRDGGFRRDGIKRFLGDAKANQHVRAGDIVMAVTDMTQERRIVARAARVPRMNEESAVFSMDVVKIEPRDPAERDFLYAMLRHSSFPDEVKKHANGANVLHLTPDRIDEYVAALPPPTLSRHFASLVRPLFDQQDVLALKNDELRTTRDLLLPRLVSGEIELAS